MEVKFNKKLVTYLLIRRRRKIVIPSKDFEKWVYIHENVMVPVCVKTHIWLSFSKSKSFPIGFRGQQLWWVKAAIQMIRFVNETACPCLVNECEHLNWV